MKIELKSISVRELVKGYHDDGDDGVRDYGGKLLKYADLTKEHTASHLSVKSREGKLNCGKK